MSFRFNLEISPRFKPYADVVRHIFSGSISIFALFLIIFGILSGQSAFSNVFPGVPTWIALILFVFAGIFLGIIEGLHVCVLDMQRHSGEPFRESYPSAYELHKLTSGENIKNTSSFIIGRQVQLIFTVFFLALLTSLPGMDNFPFTDSPFPIWFKVVFLDNGIISAIMLASICQLVPELIATTYPVQFMDIKGCKFVVEIAIWIDKIGLAHASWAICYFFVWAFRMDHSVTERLQKEKATKIIPDEDNTEKSRLQKLGNTVLKYARYTFSISLTIFSLFMVIYGLSTGQTSFATTFVGAPAWVGLVCFLVVEFWLSFLEGCIVPVVDLSKHKSDTYEAQYKRAAALHARCSSESAVSRFLIGRQLNVIFAIFLASNMTSLTGMTTFPFTDAEFPEWFQTFILSTGLLGSFVTVIFSQLASQIIAADYPVQYMNILGLKIVIWVCWIVEMLGFCHTSWLIYWLASEGLNMNIEITEEIKKCIVIEDIAAASEDFWNFTPPDLTKGGFRNGFIFPHRVANKMMEDGIRVPQFLFPPRHAAHVPPHVITLELMALLETTESREKARKILYNYTQVPDVEEEERSGLVRSGRVSISSVPSGRSSISSRPSSAPSRRTSISSDDSQSSDHSSVVEEVEIRVD